MADTELGSKTSCSIDRTFGRQGKTGTNAQNRTFTRIIEENTSSFLTF